MTRIQSSRHAITELHRKLDVLEGLVQCAVYHLSEHEGKANLSNGLLHGFHDFRIDLERYLQAASIRDNLRSHP